MREEEPVGVDVRGGGSAVRVAPRAERVSERERQTALPFLESCMIDAFHWNDRVHHKRTVTLTPMT